MTQLAFDLDALLGVTRPPPLTETVCSWCGQEEPNPMLLENSHCPTSLGSKMRGMCMAQSLPLNHARAFLNGAAGLWDSRHCKHQQGHPKTAGDYVTCAYQAFLERVEYLVPLRIDAYAELGLTGCSGMEEVLERWRRDSSEV